MVEVWPHANIGAAMGKESDTIVVDCDTQDAIDVVESHNPDTAYQNTGSGFRQYFFQYEEGLRNWGGLLYRRFFYEQERNQKQK